MEEVQQNIRLANKYRDEAYVIRDKQYDMNIFYFCWCGPAKRETYCWEMFEYYSSKVRNYYKKKNELSSVLRSN